MSWEPQTGAAWIRNTEKRLRRQEKPTPGGRLRAYTTANRPTAAAAGVGVGIFNTTTARPNWSDGTNWRDANGALA